uniref:sperm-associated antigen 17-like n=1 Tax=Myxine glutinosa TaxID=7769 RepID=UPI00358EBBC8
MLGTIGVSISAVVCISAGVKGPTPTEALVPHDIHTPPSEAQVPPCEGPNVAELETFWHTLGPTLEFPKWWAYLHDVVRLECFIEDGLPTPVDFEHETVTPRAVFVFDKVAHLVYQLLQWQVHHGHYISSTRFLTTPSTSGSSGGSVGTSPGIKRRTTHSSFSLTTKKNTGSVARSRDVASSDFQRPTEVDLHYYEALMKSVPLECCSTSLILHCLLEQVVASEEGWSLPSSPESSVVSDSLHPEIAQTLALMINDLAIESTEKEILADFAPPEAIQTNTPIAPKLISYGDEIYHRTHHLEPTRGLDVSRVELQMLNLILLSKIMRTTPGSIDKLQRAHAQHLLQHCSVGDNRSDMVVHHAIMQFVLESLELPQIGTPERGTAIPWDRPLAFVEKPVSTSSTPEPLEGTEESNIGVLQGEANGSKEEMQEAILTDIKSTQLRCLDDWTYCETYRPSVLIQLLLNAHETYHSMQRYSLASEDSILFCFYNPLTQPLQLQETWHCSLHTNIYFRDYLEHVADSISKWIEKEFVNGPMDITDYGRMKLNDCPDMTPEVDTLKNSSIGEKGAQADNFESLTSNTSIRKKSLKGQAKEAEQVKEVENKKGKNGESKRAPSSAKKKEPLAAHLVKDQDVVLPTKVGTEPLAKANATPLQPVFFGYEMDHKLVHLSGTDKTLFPVGGGEIHVKTTHFVKEPLVDEMQPSVQPELFSVVLADGIVLSFGESRGHCETEGDCE